MLNDECHIRLCRIKYSKVYVTLWIQLCLDLSFNGPAAFRSKWFILLKHISPDHIYFQHISTIVLFEIIYFTLNTQ